MKIKKGKFKVATGDGVVYRDGSYATCYPFYIHRICNQTYLVIILIMFEDILLFRVCNVVVSYLGIGDF